MDLGEVMKAYIFGSGGFAKEVLQLALDAELQIDAFISEQYGLIGDYAVMPENNLSSQDEFLAYIAVGSPATRRKIVKNLLEKFPGQVQFPNLIHPSARIMGLKNERSIKMGHGNIVTANCVLTSHITIGNFCHFNLSTTIGHDTAVGDYFTTAPGVNISGNNHIGDCVYFGTNSCTREKIQVGSDVVVGAGAVVVSNLSDVGIYAGIPAKKIK